MSEEETAIIAGGAAVAGAAAIGVKAAGCMHPDALRAALDSTPTQPHARTEDSTEAARHAVERATED